MITPDAQSTAPDGKQYVLTAARKGTLASTPTIFAGGGHLAGWIEDAQPYTLLLERWRTGRRLGIGDVLST